MNNQDKNTLRFVLSCLDMYADHKVSEQFKDALIVFRDSSVGEFRSTLDRIIAMSLDDITAWSPEHQRLAAALKRNLTETDGSLEQFNELVEKSLKEATS